MIALALLAVAAAVVSYWAQFVMVHEVKGSRWAAAVEAGIPDVAAAVFAALGVALALQGKRALRPRALNVAAIATSIGMNYLAAGDGWRNAAIWVMPPVAYALASDTAIGVIRAWAVARQQQLDEDLADEGVTPLSVLGGVVLWLLRLSLDLRGTMAGFRQWVLTNCPIAPGTRAALPGSSKAAAEMAALPAAATPGSATTPRSVDRTTSVPRPASKRAQLIEAYEALDGVDPRYGDRAAISQVAKELAADAGLQWGSARSYLYRHMNGQVSS